MRKVFLFLLLLIVSVGGVSATTITKTLSSIAEANSWVTASGSGTQTCYTSFNLDDNITISTSGSANCGSYWGSDWRLYQNKGGDVTVSANNGYVITSITFTYAVANTGTLKDGETTVASGSAQTFTPNTNPTFKRYTVGNTGEATNGQVKITQISVTYEDPNIDTFLPGNITYSSTGYCAWTGIGGLSSGASYAGNTNNVSTKIQLKNDNTVGIVVTGSVGRVKKISIAWNSGTVSNRTLNVYGTNTPYTIVGVGSNEESLGSFSSNDQSVTELTIDAEKNYGYIRLAATGGALYLDKIQIEWDKTVVPITIGSAGWISYVAPENVYFPTGTTGYIATDVNTNAIHLEEVLAVESSTPVLIEGSAGTYALEIVDAQDCDDVSENILLASDGSITGDGSTIYALGVGKAAPNKGVVGFFIVENDATIPAGKAYLTYSSGDLAPSMLRIEDELNNATDIRETRDADKAVKFIQNGQLYILRNYVVYDALGRVIR